MASETASLSSLTVFVYLTVTISAVVSPCFAWMVVGMVVGMGGGDGQSLAARCPDPSAAAFHLALVAVDIAVFDGAGSAAVVAAGVSLSLLFVCWGAVCITVANTNPPF